jgi:hypothetical protein
LEETWLFEQNIYNKGTTSNSSAENPNTMVWNLWSRKEAAYKIYNRATGIRGYFPLNLECAYENSTTGSVAWDIHSIRKP